jgi:hypothetical protein
MRIPFGDECGRIFTTIFEADKEINDRASGNARWQSRYLDRAQSVTLWDFVAGLGRRVPREIDGENMMPFVQPAKLEQVCQSGINKVRLFFQFASTRISGCFGHFNRTAR